MSVLIDCSVWIDYFRDARHSQAVDRLIEDNALVVNDLVLTELIPSLMLKRHQALVRLMKTLRRLPLRIDWENLITMQTKCLRKGINRVGIPDLIIAQNVMQNGTALYTLDWHFRLMHQHFPLILFQE